MNTIPEQIIKYCKATGLTSAEVARRLGLTPGALCNYKKGRRPIRAEQFEALKTLASARRVPKNKAA